MQRPQRPQIYHIVHVDRLPSIIADGSLWSDAILAERPRPGTVIGMNQIKQRRLTQLRLSTHPGLYVGQCVPFYFCPRSIMLYLIHCGNHVELAYRGGQEPIIHLQCDLLAVTEWADRVDHRWAFTLSNAGAFYFEDRADLVQLDEINWDAIDARRWSGGGIPARIKEGKQAEFLIERSVAWHLVRRIGVKSRAIAQRAADAMAGATHRPPVEIRESWYY